MVQEAAAGVRREEGRGRGEMEMGGGVKESSLVLAGGLRCGRSFLTSPLDRSLLKASGLGQLIKRDVISDFRMLP